jgi:hypothetical protein
MRRALLVALALVALAASLVVTHRNLEATRRDIQALGQGRGVLTPDELVAKYGEEQVNGN